MEQLDLAEIKTIQLGILKVFDRFCKENNLRYSLTYGSLLGAVRHKGFIPWDDDIDIMMPRPDYMKFIESFNTKQSEFRVLSIYNNKNHPYPFAKVDDVRTKFIEFSDLKYDIGVNIDIFPVDGVPSDMKKYLRHFNKIKRYRDKLAVKIVKIACSRNLLKNSILLILKIVFFFVPYQKLIKNIEEEILKYSFDECKYGMLPCINLHPSFRVEKIIFENYTRAEFEGEKFSIIKEYDKYLSILYGDYMKLPPIEQQVTHHAYKAFLR